MHSLQRSFNLFTGAFFFRRMWKKSQNPAAVCFSPCARPIPPDLPKRKKMIVVWSGQTIKSPVMPDLKDLTVVYVEDEELVREKIEKSLRRRVSQIHVAGNGKEGLELVQRSNPDLIITDLEMPVMTGLEMIKRIRQQAGAQKPIIVVTAYKDEEHFTELADAYVYKPVILVELIEVMTRLSQSGRQS